MDKEQLFNQYKLNTKREKRKIVTWQLLLFVFLLISWEILSKFRILDPLLFSSPTEVIELLIRKLQDLTLVPHILTTFFETIISFIVGTVGGVLFATSLTFSKKLSDVLSPYIVVLNAMPKVALGPILLVIFGPNVVAVIAMGIFISIIITTIVIFGAFQQVNENCVKVLTMLQANKKQIFWHATLPSAIPTIISTMKVNIGLAWVGVIVGEYLVSTKGLGYLIISGFQIFNFNIVFLALCIIVVLAATMYKVLEYFEKWLLTRFNF